MTRNEARAKENMSPLEGLDQPLIPLNMAAVTETGEVVELTPQNQPGERAALIQESPIEVLMPVIWNILDRALTRETNAIRRQIKTNRIADMVSEYESHRAFVINSLEPIARSIEKCIGENCIQRQIAFAAHLVDSRMKVFAEQAATLGELSLPDNWRDRWFAHDLKYFKLIFEDNSDETRN